MTIFHFIFPQSKIIYALQKWVLVGQQWPTAEFEPCNVTDEFRKWGRAPQMRPLMVYSCKKLTMKCYFKLKILGQHNSLRIHDARPPTLCNAFTRNRLLAIATDGRRPSVGDSYLHKVISHRCLVRFGPEPLMFALEGKETLYLFEPRRQ